MSLPADEWNINHGDNAATSLASRKQSSSMKRPSLLEMSREQYETLLKRALGHSRKY